MTNHFFVCFHAGRAVGTYGTLRSAILAGECEALREFRRVNVYPVDSDGRKGARVACINPYSTLAGRRYCGIEYRATA